MNAPRITDTALYIRGVRLFRQAQPRVRIRLKVWGVSIFQGEI